MIAKARRFTPGVGSHDDYAMESGGASALTFGYGLIDAEDIGPALRQLRKELRE